MSLQTSIALELQVTERPWNVQSMVHPPPWHVSSCLLDPCILSLVLRFMVIGKRHSPAIAASHTAGIASVRDVDISGCNHTYISSTTCKILRNEVITIVNGNVMPNYRVNLLLTRLSLHQVVHLVERVNQSLLVTPLLEVTIQVQLHRKMTLHELSHLRS